MSDIGTINYYLRMVVTSGFSQTSIDYLNEFGVLEFNRGRDDGYKRGYEEALVDVAAEGVTSVTTAAEATAGTDVPVAPAKASSKAPKASV